jgi:ribosomal protein S18 acetylase RimI-like enzyme
MRRLIDSPTAHVLVAEAGGHVIGTAVVLFRPRSSIARLYSIAVAPHMSRRGVGTRLLAAVERLAVAGQRRCVRLEVHESNGRAISRYSKSGYQQFGRLAAYYEDGGDALRFEKPVGTRRGRARGPA